MRSQLKLAILVLTLLFLACIAPTFAQHTITSAPPGQTTASPQQGSPSQPQQGLPTTPAQSAVTGIPATQPAAQQAGTPDSSAPNDDLVIGNGDLLEVSVYGAQDFDKKDVRVDNDGKISLPFVGAVTVGGLTVRKAEERVANALSKGGFYNDPQVSIFEKEYTTQGISVLGEVQKPGIYPLLGQRTLFDAISAAGGTTQRAGNTVTITHRGKPNQPEIVTLTYNADAKAGTPTSNVPVLPGDTVAVSKAGIVYVVGDVRMPSGIVLENSKMTVLQAIAMAQGYNPNAKLSEAKLIRTAANGERQEIPLPLNKILSSKAPDVPLQAEDIIFVPTSVAKSATKRSLEAVLQMATGIAIYRHP